MPEGNLTSRSPYPKPPKTPPSPPAFPQLPPLMLLHRPSPNLLPPNPNDLNSWISKLISTIFLLSSPSQASSRLPVFRSALLNPSIASLTVLRLPKPSAAAALFSAATSDLPSAATILSKSGLPISALSLLDQIISQNINFESSLLGELLLSFAQIGDIDGAVEILRRAFALKRPLKAAPFNCLMNVLVGRDCFKDAIILFKEQLALGSFVPDACSFNIFIKCLVRIGEIEEAVEAFDSMGNFGCEPDSFSYNIVVHGLCKSNQVERAKSILRGGSSSQFFVGYTSIMSGFCKMGRMKDACEMFDEMLESGIKPSGVTFNVLIDGFGKIGDVSAAAAVYESMIAAGNSPDVVTFTSLIDGNCRAGNIEAAMKRWREMPEKKILPNCRTFAVMVNGLCKMNWLREAREILVELHQRRDLAPLPFVFNPAIDGFCKAGNLQAAMEILKEMEERECAPDKVTYTILIIGHCVKGKIGDAVAMFSRMIAKGCKPDSITVGSLVSCLLKAGMPGEAHKVMISSLQEAE